MRLQRLLPGRLQCKWGRSLERLLQKARSEELVATLARDSERIVGDSIGNLPAHNPTLLARQPLEQRVKRRVLVHGPRRELDRESRADALVRVTRRRAQQRHERCCRIYPAGPEHFDRRATCLRLRPEPLGASRHESSERRRRVFTRASHMQGILQGIDDGKAAAVEQLARPIDERHAERQ
eukprot:5601333-Prymnesium_polylepis.1